MIDFHCHLDLYPDPKSLIRHANKIGYYILSVTTTPSAWKGTSDLAKGYPTIKTGLGLHPQLVYQRKHEIVLFEQLLPEARYVGEVGLDGGSEYKGSWGEQVNIFDHILKLCENNGGRILSVHSRRSAAAVLKLIGLYPGCGTPILHWFSGTTRQLGEAVEQGCWFSVGPAMLSGNKGRRLASLMPRNRVLTESDGPFAQLKGRCVLPWDVDVAIADLGSIWGESISNVKKQLKSNLNNLIEN